MSGSTLCPSRDDGFTLIEMLVVILIVGILTAIAIPAFSNARDQANDTPAKEMARNAQTAAETLAVDTDGNYATVTKATLHTYEPTIATTSTNTNAYVSAASGTAGTYTLTVTAVETGNKFKVERSAEGAVARTCTLAASTAPHGGCENVKGTKGTW